VRILCTKIIFTNDTRSAAKELSGFMMQNGIKHRLADDDETTELTADTDDEGLYALCCHMGVMVFDICVKRAIRFFLDKRYACFNTDECNIICCNVLRREFVSELPGRMYIYLKVNQTINPVAFFRFMCRDISQDAMLAAEEEAEKLIGMNENSDFIELLKCFSSISDDSLDRVVLTADSRGVRITDFSPQKENMLTEYGCDESDILAELVTMNPKLIQIHGKEHFLNNEISSVITAVFEERIEYE